MRNPSFFDQNWWLGTHGGIALILKMCFNVHLNYLEPMQVDVVGGDYPSILNVKLDNGVLWLPANLVDNATRQRISNIFKLDEPIPLVDRMLEEITGIKVLESRYDSRAYICANYAFGVRHGESWAVPYQGTLYDQEHPLWTDTKNFLDSKGYFQVQRVSTGDIVYYQSYAGGQHFGVLATDSIHSKLGRCSIVQHPYELTPLGYGDKVNFFRKRNKEISY